MQVSESYEWLLDSCLQECRKGISRLEQLAASSETEAPTWLQEELAELLSLEAAAQHAFESLRRNSNPSEASRELSQERLDRLQARLLESFQRLTAEGVVADCT